VSFEEPTDEDMAARRTIIDTDPPEHAKLRKIVASTFSQRAVAVYEHFITGLTEQVLGLPAGAAPPTSCAGPPPRTPRWAGPPSGRATR
jgi:cytochrome P450